MVSHISEQIKDTELVMVAQFIDVIDILDKYDRIEDIKLDIKNRKKAYLKYIKDTSNSRSFLALNLYNKNIDRKIRKAKEAYKENERIKNELGRDATISELASKLEVSEEEISMAIDSSMEVESLHQTIYQNDGNEIYLMDKLKNEEGCEEEAINKVMISQILNEMTDNERRLIKMRYFSNMSQKDVGEQLGISQVQVSRLEKRI